MWVLTEAIVESEVWLVWRPWVCISVSCSTRRCMMSWGRQLGSWMCMEKALSVVASLEWMPVIDWLLIMFGGASNQVGVRESGL